MVTTTKFLKLPEVQIRTGKSRSSIYQGIKDGTFPKPIKLGPRAIGFIESEIEAHNQSCIIASRPGESETDDSPADDAE
ncbi:MAG: AlpA family transcriptional regulator [Proteobacteria bacterium]|nr:AlpA family transcriptional regulator [Pseudomonadota bacterium]